MISADVKAQDLVVVFMYLWLSKPISFWKIKSGNNNDNVFCKYLAIRSTEVPCFKTWNIYNVYKKGM